MKRYEQAVALIQQEHYSEAYELLKALLHDGYQHDDMKWAIGLTSIFLGNPFQAITYWQQLQQPERFHAAEKIEQVKRVLPKYEQLYTSYNEALDLLQAGNEQEAWAKFKQLMVFDDAIPLEVYEGYVQCALLVNAKTQLNSTLASAPRYVQQHAAIKKMQQLAAYEEQQQMKQLQQSQQAVRKKQRGLVTTTASLAVVSAALLLLAVLPDASKPTVIEAEPKPIVEAKELVIAQTEAQAAELTRLQQQIEQLEQKQQQMEEERTILAQVGMPVEALMDDARLQQYERGYEAYRQGDFEHAITSLETSITQQPDAYYVDDALYFLIQAKRKLDTSDVHTLYEQFLQSDSTHVMTSPYYDDVMLQYAALHVKNGETAEAKTWLTNITANYDGEWTAEEAKRMLTEL
ncbi:MAG: hypothetical protein UHX00_10335 [Caryophanon sp.]|nr:hypothetical protein [Caryophanon sp.]